MTTVHVTIEGEGGCCPARTDETRAVDTGGAARETVYARGVAAEGGRTPATGGVAGCCQPAAARDEEAAACCGDDCCGEAVELAAGATTAAACCAPDCCATA